MGIHLDADETFFFLQLIDEHLHFFYRLAKENRGDRKDLMNLYIKHTSEIGNLKKFVMQGIDLAPYRRLGLEVIAPARTLNAKMKSNAADSAFLKDRTKKIVRLYKIFGVN